MQRLRPWLAFLVVAQTLMSFSATGALHMPTFTAGTNTYTNVTVTASKGGRVLVDHGRGMASVRVRDLDLDVQQQLVDAGLVNPMVAKEIEKDIAKRDAAKKRAERTFSGTAGGLTLENAETTPVARLLSAQLEQQAAKTDFKFNLEWLTGRFGQAIVTGISAAGFLFAILRWFLFYRICKNATGQGSFLVFVPLFRWIPLADAAGISKRWLLVPVLAATALFFPPPTVEQFWWAARAYLGLVAALWIITLLLYVVWCFRICRNLGRSAIWAVFLFFPLLDYIALFVLAAGQSNSDDSPLGTMGSLKNPVLAI